MKRMDEESKNLFPRGSLKRLIKPTLDQKECRISPEYMAALNRHLSKLAVDYTFQACENALGRNRKTLDLQALKDVGDKNGFLVE